ncbi:hypothetical protein WKH31_13965 [Metabacillus indicus]
MRNDHRYDHDPNYNRKKKKKDIPGDDGCMPSCLDFFIIPLQFGVLGYQLLNLI